MNTESFQERSYISRPSVIALVLIGFVLLALAARFLDMAKQSSWRANSMNNLRQIVRATLSYESVYSRFPTASASMGSNGDQFGWEIQIRPFIDTFCDGWGGQLDRSWNHPDSREMFQYEFAFFHSPLCEKKTDDNGYSLNHYAATLEAIPMDEAKTVETLDGNAKMFGEIAEGFQPWCKPGNSRSAANGVRFDESSFGNPTGNGVAFAFKDGSVQYRLVDEVQSDSSVVSSIQND